MRHDHTYSAAFAEGRRLRDEARRRRHPPHRHPARRASGAALLLVLVFLMTSAMAGIVALSIVTAAFGAVFMPIVPVLLGLSLIHLVARPNRRRRNAMRLAAGPGTAPLPPRRPTPPRRATPPPRPQDTWAQAHQRFCALRLEYANFECDTAAVLRLPALADVTVPSTARFVDAFAEAQALETDQYPPAPHAAAFGHAVDKAVRAWHAARDAAERIRLSHLEPTERASIERILKLLTTARDSDNDAERLAAYSLARSELAKLDRAGVLHLPRAAQAALDVAARGQLPA